MKRNLYIFAVGLLLLGTMAANVAAATIELTLTEELYSQSVSRTVDGGSNWYNTTAGLFHFTVGTNGTLQPGDLGYTDIYTFCIEPREFISPGQTVMYNVAALDALPTNIAGMGTTKANLLRELYGKYYPGNTASIAPDTAAALQIATWEIVRENSGSLNVYQGDVQFKPTTYANLAQAYLNDVAANNLPMRTNIMGAGIVGAQDTWFPVPEPSLVILLGIGLAAVTVLKKRIS
jgi:hypothetical protein